MALLRDILRLILSLVAYGATVFGTLTVLHRALNLARHGADSPFDGTSLIVPASSATAGVLLLVLLGRARTGRSCRVTGGSSTDAFSDGCD